MSRRKREEPKETVDPFDQTRVIPGVPELPQEATLVLPINQPRPEFGAPAGTVKPVAPEPPPTLEAAPPKPRRLALVAAWIGAAALLTAGFSWWLLGSGPSTSGAKVSASAADTLPPSMQGYLDAANHGDAKAMRMLGACYTYGLGVRVNKAAGLDWYRKAAEAGDKTAQQELQAAGGGR